MDNEKLITERNVEFGSRDNFCIRIGYSKKSKKLYLQFWLKGIQWGNFKRSATLEYSIKTYQKIVKNKLLLYFPQTDGLSKEEIWKYMWCINEEGELDYEKFRKLNDIGAFPIFGQHFGNQQCRHTLTYKNESLRFMWQNDFGHAVNDVQIKFEDFCSAFEEYKTYCEVNSLI